MLSVFNPSPAESSVSSQSRDNHSLIQVTNRTLLTVMWQEVFGLFLIKTVDLQKRVRNTSLCSQHSNSNTSTHAEHFLPSSELTVQTETSSVSMKTPTASSAASPQERMDPDHDVSPQPLHCETLCTNGSTHSNLLTRSSMVNSKTTQTGRGSTVFVCNLWFTHVH